MFTSILLPVGSTDIDGPDFIVLPWSGEIETLFHKRSSAAQNEAQADGNFASLRFRLPEAIGFYMPETDDEWFGKLENMHVENTVLGVDQTALHLLRRWESLRVKMPDPPRVSFYNDGSAFLSGPLGVSAHRWETSCGLTFEESGKVAPAYKQR